MDVTNIRRIFVLTTNNNNKFFKPPPGTKPIVMTTISNTIFQQIGGLRFKIEALHNNIILKFAEIEETENHYGGCSINVKQFSGPFMFRIEVLLTFADDYTVKVIKADGEVIQQESEIYCDMLQDTIAEIIGLDKYSAVEFY